MSTQINTPQGGVPNEQLWWLLGCIGFVFVLLILSQCVGGMKKRVCDRCGGGALEWSDFSSTWTCQSCGWVEADA